MNKKDIYTQKKYQLLIYYKKLYKNMGLIFPTFLNFLAFAISSFCTKTLWFNLLSYNKNLNNKITFFPLDY